MKKVLIVLSAIAMAFVARAANVNWTLTNIANLNDANVTASKDNYSTFTAYLVDSSFGINDFLTALDNGTLTGNSNIKETTQLGYNARGGGVRVNYTSTSGSYTVNQEYSFYTVVLNEDSSYYLMTGTKSGSPKDLADLDMGWGSVDNYSGLAWTAVPDSTPVTPGGEVPEPTSGLLLVVGGALLALRRRQK